ncbi:MAG: hypothetical protein IJY65_05520 [Clostridia bacterium]|nr:hypothetical protein [Clostridia bacterium]
MAYKTKFEKQAYRTGLLNGLKRKIKKRKDSADQKAWRKNMLVWEKNGKPYNPPKSSMKRASRHKVVKRRLGQAARSDNPFGMTYAQMLREEELRKRDFLGDFDYDSRGRIKGTYIDGKFEPD